MKTVFKNSFKKPVFEEKKKTEFLPLLFQKNKCFKITSLKKNREKKIQTALGMPMVQIPS